MTNDEERRLIYQKEKHRISEKKKKNGDGYLYSIKFVSLNEYSSLIPKYMILPKYHDISKDSKWTYGTIAKDREETLNLARKGASSKKVLKKVEEISSREYRKLQPFLEKERAFKPTKAKHYYGTTFNANAYFQGESKIFTKTRILQKRKTLRVGICFSMSYQNNEDSFIEIVSTAVAVVKCAERMGLATEVVAHATCWIGDGSESSFYFPVKKAGDAFDIQKICAIGLPGLLRDFKFCYMDILHEGYVSKDFKDCEITSGYGRNNACSEEALLNLGIDTDISLKWKDGEQKLDVGAILEKAIEKKKEISSRRRPPTT